MVLSVVLWINILINLVLFFMAFFRLRKTEPDNRALPQLFPLGIFVWEDALILSPFWIISSLFLWWLNNWRYFVLFVLLFIAAREFFETVYWLFQQFSTHAHRPRDFGFKHLNNNSIYILYQLSSFCLALLALFLFIFIYEQQYL